MKHDGWTNEAERGVVRLLDGDLAARRREIVRPHAAARRFTTLAAELRTLVEGRIPWGGGFVEELAQAALDGVGWHGIAIYYIDKYNMENES